MHVTYLGHSGFAVQTAQAEYLFDYVRGELPQWREGLPLYIFVSHSHADHLSDKIFAREIAERAEAYILSDDVRRKYRRRKPDWMEALEPKIRWARPGEEPALPGVSVKPLKSTDIGVAYAVYEKDGTALYHAGDLNWWHWDGEDRAWNRNMEVNYRREVDSLAGETFDAAFLPLDPRLGAACGYGFRYFLEKVRVKHVFPMHFWEEYDVIPRFLAGYREENAAQIHMIEREGQSFEI